MFKVIRADTGHKDFKEIEILLDEELGNIYGISKARCDLSTNSESILNTVLVYDKGQIVGCGSFHIFDKVSIEIKRMFVKSSFRGRGIAALIVSELEYWAKELGYSRSVLETGNKQPEAVKCYKKIGYAIIENYAPYKNSQISICLAKDLCK